MLPDDLPAAVIDCSVLVDVLMKHDLSALESTQLHAPTLIDYELASAAARLDRAKAAKGSGADLLIEASRLGISRHDADLLMYSMWLIRHRVSLYDAAYVALAQILGLPLLTSDRRLAATAAGLCGVIEAP